MTFCWSDYKTIKGYEKGGRDMQPGRKIHKYSSWTPHMKRVNGKLWCTCSESTVVLKVYVNKKLQTPPFCARLRKRSCSLQCKVTSVQPCVGDPWQRNLTTWRVEWKFLRFQLRVVRAQQLANTWRQSSCVVHSAVSCTDEKRKRTRRIYIHRWQTAIRV
jgi:hypothetical protein